MIRKPWFCQDCRVMMHYNAKDDCHICPVCGTQVWHEHEKPKDKASREIMNFMHEMAPTHRTVEALPAGEALPGGSHSNSSGRKKGQKKDPLSTLNKKLFVET